MEQVHGVDVSWMTQGSFKDKSRFSVSTNKALGPAQPRQLPIEISQPVTEPPHATPEVPSKSPTTNGSKPVPINTSTNGQKRNGKTGSADKTSGSSASPLTRRSSWFSNISSKFSSSTSPPPPQQQNQQQSQTPPQSPIRPPDLLDEPPVPKIVPVKNAVLQPGARPEGDGPYTPAPPKNGQAGFLGVFRRLSTSGNASTTNSKLGNGLVERKVLNIDSDRERCPITELKDNKLRRVSFFVDVEIAPMPKYTDGEVDTPAIDKAQKRKMTEAAEGDALKNPKAAEAKKEEAAAKAPAAAAAATPPPPTGSNENAKTPEPEANPEANPEVGDEKKLNKLEKVNTAMSEDSISTPPKEMTRKKEKKKKSEEERKARKEKKRRLAEANGSVPVEIHFDTSDSSDSPGSKTPKTSSFPTTNPIRIYRRCCQLRETPILKRITEQLGENSNNTSSTPGFVNKLDLSGYWMQLPDLITLGDYLAVVPVRELVLNNCGLTDEGLRVILAGLLAARRPESGRRKSRRAPEMLGGVVERLSLKENDIGCDGWKHLSLFIYLSHSLKNLDVSHIPFPRQASCHTNNLLPNGVQLPLGIANIISKAIAERPAGSTLEMLNISETEPSMEQLGLIIDGAIKCGIRRLGVSHNQLDLEGWKHVARYIQAGICEGIDLGGNDILPYVDSVMPSLLENSPLWAISLAGCNLNPSALSKILPSLMNHTSLRFVDFSHNHDLFNSKPNAVGILRRYLPKFPQLKRIHLQDVNMTAEQAIAVVEVLPEARTLCHINLLDNTEIQKLANAEDEQGKEEACALYASLMAATRISRSLICVDIEVPSDSAGEIVKAMAKQVVAYCLRNMERGPDSEIASAVASALAEANNDSEAGAKPSSCPNIVAHIGGHDVLEQEFDGDDATADEDYLIGGTGVAKALSFCLANRGDDSARPSGEFVRDVETDELVPVRAPRLPVGGKAKDLSKHLLAGARKIRQRLQPALSKAQSQLSDDILLRRLTFLDQTLQGIINRFEDEYPDTREDERIEAAANVKAHQRREERSPSPSTSDDAAITASDGDGEGDLNSRGLDISKSNTVLSKELAEEEARVHRAGHRFRTQVMGELDVENVIDEVRNDPKQIHVLKDLAEEAGGEFLEKVKQKGLIQAFVEDKELLFRLIENNEPDYWARFVESQRKARANMELSTTPTSPIASENAIAD